MQKNILSILAKKSNQTIAIATALTVFSIQYYLMSTLPGEVNLACVPGGSLTTKNIFFSLLLSTAIGLLVTGLKETILIRSQNKLALASTSTFGLITGSLTIFCTFCTIPVLSLFGLSISLSFITFHETSFQLVSLAAILSALYLVNKQLKGNCQTCNRRK